MGSLRALLLASVLALSACSTPSGTSESFCAVNEPKRLTTEQRAQETPDAKRERLRFNQYGAQVCGWKP